MVNVIIAGSRDFTDEKLLFTAASNWAGFGQLDAMSPGDLTVICGGARGADTLGEVWAVFHGVAVKHMPANWDKHGRSAGHIRNAEMADAGDVLLAFWDGESKGTKGMIDVALKKGLEVHVYRV